MKRIIFLLLASFLFTSNVLADNNQYGQYGGNVPSYTIFIDKMVSNGMQTKGGIVTYVDNVSPADYRFSPGQEVFFLVKVKNTSNVILHNVYIKDVIPDYLYPVKGPGSYNSNNHTISWTYDSLQPNEERSEYLSFKLFAQNELPTDRGVICLRNHSEVSADNAHDADDAQFCVEKQVVEYLETVPKAGPGLGLALTTLNIAGLGLGIYIKSKG
ncbi:DUF11 domain-containing protein [Candidatus Woesebacteria bacterium]|nr:DUF11 domain-containing protein [Candidatus Woesebacteria bacterium]